MPLDDLHENGIRRGEIVELAEHPVLPLHAMEQIVAVAEDDDEDSGDAISRVVVAVFDDGPDDRLVIVLPKMQVIEVKGESAVREVSLS